MQATHGQADRLAHPLDLVRASLVERELDPPRAEPPRPRGRRRTVLQLDTGAQTLERPAGQRTIDVGLVHLRHAVARMRETMSQIPVVREDERSRRVRVETSDRHDARVGRNQRHYGATALGVARGGHDSCRLVQEQVCEALESNALAVDLDDVMSVCGGVQLAGIAVDAHTSRSDELVRAAPGRDAGAREVGV